MTIMVMKSKNKVVFMEKLKRSCSACKHSLFFHWTRAPLQIVLRNCNAVLSAVIFRGFLLGRPPAAKISLVISVKDLLAKHSHKL